MEINQKSGICGDYQMQRDVTQAPLLYDPDQLQYDGDIPKKNYPRGTTFLLKQV